MVRGLFMRYGATPDLSCASRLISKWVNYLIPRFMSALLTCLISRSRKSIPMTSRSPETWRYSAHPRWESLQQQLMRFYRSQLRIRQIHLTCTSWTSVTRHFLLLRICHRLPIISLLTTRRSSGS